jgi:hypothetical protein
MYRVQAALIASALSLAALPTAASAGCYNCYAPPAPCGSCYQPQYRAVHETVMVDPGHVVAYRTPPRYRTVMVPRTVMVSPGHVHYEHTAPQYAVRERLEAVAPAPVYYAPPVAQGCGSCGYSGGYSFGGGYGYGY